MCGIAGVVSASGPVRPDQLARMVARQRHRGPDDAATWVSPCAGVGLGHARLAVLDLTAAGRQPMANEAGNIHIAHNGEVYNYRALRAELERTGPPFRTATDTEVILRGYEVWGDDVVSRLHGMFAFAVWDSRRRRLLLARDRLGIKPLHWSLEDGVFAFASELKGLEAALPRPRRIEVSALWDFLTYGYVPTPKTVWRSVHKLPPAHTLVLEEGKVSIDPYWDVDFGRPCPARSDEDLAEELRAHLEEAVRSHLVSDVPLGVLLSGGVDSSAVVAFATRADRPIRSFCLGFGTSTLSEAKYARVVAERFGTEHVEGVAAGTAHPGAFGEMVEWFDEPFADTSALPTAWVCRLAREGVTVALSGDGGDELFDGYRRYGKFCRHRSQDVLPAAIRSLLGGPAARLFAPGSKARRTVHRWAMGELERYVMLHGGMTRAEKRDAFPSPIRARFHGYDDTWAFRRHWREDLDPRSRLQYLDLKTYLPDDLLTKVDRASMRVALEVRPPLLDHRLVEFAATIPDRQRARPGATKHFLKKALRGILGPESLDRGKQGFSIPLERCGLLAGSPEAAAWPLPQRVAWALLKQWTRAKLGVADPTEVLREGP